MCWTSKCVGEKEMQSFILIKTDFEALHHWPNAPSSEKYLQYPHRHLFVVTLEVGTTHLDREIEINAAKRWVDSVIKRLNNVSPSDDNLVHLGSLSCEKIAKLLVEAIISKYGSKRYVKCTVLEDGILGAGFTYLEPANSSD